MKTKQMGSRWYCLFFGYYTRLSDAEILNLGKACSRLVKNVVYGDKRIFFEVDLSRPSINLGSVQYKIQRFSETWDLPYSLWQWGVGRTPAEAWVQTRWKSLTPSLLPIEALDDVLHPLQSSIHQSGVQAGGLGSVGLGSVGLGAANYHILRCLGFTQLQDLTRMPHDLMLARISHVLSHPDVLALGLEPSEGALNKGAVADGTVTENWMSELTRLSLQSETFDLEVSSEPVLDWVS